jgi:branched-chain amino acid transport system permease protein
MQAAPSSAWRKWIGPGMIAGGMCVFMALVGVVEAFGQRYLVSGVVTMGQVLMLVPLTIVAYSTVQKSQDRTPAHRLILGAEVGLIGGLLLSVLLLVGDAIDIRAMFVNASPVLFGLLGFGLSFPINLAVPLIAGALAGGVGAAMLLLPPRTRHAVVLAVVWVGLIGLLRDLIVTVMLTWGPVASLFMWMFASRGLTIPAGILLLAIIGGLTYWRGGARATGGGAMRLSATNPRRRMALYGGAIIVILLLPVVLGPFFGEILANTGIYVLMGLGLNIVVGFAGLLDLGYVAFYAIGAYTLAVLTSPELGFFNMTYWEALPFAVLASVTAGILLGLPVLKMRGDYLAIVTLGFGEIIRLLVLSDWLRPWLGGAQGIQHVAYPIVGPISLDAQSKLYYLILLAIGIAAFFAIRLKDSRLGRAWMAVREDEDVAQAMGINVVTTKLLAFACGAFFAGVSGTLFAAKLTSAYPTSFNLLVSINALSLIIVGGMGSIPGVIIGAFALVGSPDLLREFAEFRYLAYGALLITMMLVRPEGLWPEARRQLELHEAEQARQRAPTEAAATD